MKRVLTELGGSGLSYHEMRNWLIGSLASEGGMRAAGIGSLSVQSIADMLDRAGLFNTQGSSVGQYQSIELRNIFVESIRSLRKSNKRFLLLSVIEKGNSFRYVRIPIGLAEQLCMYIAGERYNYLRRRRSYSDIEMLFVSRKGGGLQVGSIKDILKDAFRVAGVDGSGHSLRAYCITAEAIRILRLSQDRTTSRFDEEGLIARLMELAGHRSAASLRHYLSIAHIRNGLLDEGY